MDSKHTPGPWRPVNSHPQNACIYVQDDDGHEVATLYGGQDVGAAQDGDGVWSAQPIRDANAHLIAAAPDMLEALHDLLTRPTDGAARVRARAAISKATGGGQ